ELPIGNWFCCMDCSRIHSALQNLLVSREEKLPESLLDVVKKKIEERERVDPIEVSSIASIDLIPKMVYGRNVRDQEFGGIYCAILLVNSTIVSAGIIRIFGEEVAELPLGYFQVLFSRIENLLGYLKVRTLVLPAGDGAESLWTNRFGFSKISEDENACIVCVALSLSSFIVLGLNRNKEDFSVLSLS
ncbi:Increased DNA methylation 1, partial [Camellia lanceoleosa]